MKKNFLISNDSFLKALEFAQAIAKQTGGRVATISDIAAMRTKKGIDDFVWNSWMTTANTLYFGTYKAKKYIVFADHFGPLNTEQRLKRWKESGRKKKGGREGYGFSGCPKINQREFNRLVEGKYGEVTLIDFNEYFTLFKETLFGSRVKVDSASQDPLLSVILGRSPETYKAFIEKHLSISKEYAEENHKEEGSAEKILELSLDDRYGWSFYNPFSKKVGFPKHPVAFMVYISRPSFWSNNDLSISTEINVSCGLNYSRFVVINDDEADLVELEFKPQKNWKSCLVPMEEPFTEDFFSLVGEQGLFVEYPKRKDGSYMDNCEPMLPVEKYEEIGNPTTFTTDNCLFFLKYHIDEVKKVAPAGANAYKIVGDVIGRDTVQVPVQFYKAKPDTEKRILRREEVMGNLDLLLKINGISLSK